MPRFFVIVLVAPDKTEIACKVTKQTKPNERKKLFNELRSQLDISEWRDYTTRVFGPIKGSNFKDRAVDRMKEYAMTKQLYYKEPGKGKDWIVPEPAPIDDAIYSYEAVDIRILEEFAKTLAPCRKRPEAVAAYAQFMFTHNIPAPPTKSRVANFRTLFGEVFNGDPTEEADRQGVSPETRARWMKKWERLKNDPNTRWNCRVRRAFDVVGCRDDVEASLEENQVKKRSVLKFISNKFLNTSLNIKSHIK